MKFYGNANLQQNLLQQPALELVSYFPETPVVGQIAFTGNVVYICISLNNGTPIWIPLTAEISAYTYFQTTAATTWTINHPLNTSALNVQVWDNTNTMVQVDAITIVSSSQVTITMPDAMTGKAVLITGVFDGNPKPTYAYEQTQVSPSTTWVITHNLGRYPGVEVFIDYQEVEPENITFTSLDVVTITFNTAQSGYVKLI